MSAPFQIGDRVAARGCGHFGVLTVTDCEWISRTAPGVSPYWRVIAALDKRPQPEHPSGGFGIVYAGDYMAPADQFALVEPSTRLVVE